MDGSNHWSFKTWWNYKNDESVKWSVKINAFNLASEIKAKWSHIWKHMQELFWQIFKWDDGWLEK